MRASENDENDNQLRSFVRPAKVVARRKPRPRRKVLSAPDTGRVTANGTLHVIMFSGGIGSWATARRVRERYNPRRLICLFADTSTEAPDLYEFVPLAVADVAGELVIIRDGRNIWQVFHDERFLGNSRIDPCSKLLKREPLRRWLAENADPAHTIVHLGIDWSEIHRFERAATLWALWRVEAPLCDPPYTSKAELVADAEARGLGQLEAYRLGFAHANCNMVCVKAGQAHFRQLFELRPERYAEAEHEEEALRAYLDKDVAILVDRRGGIRKPLPLRVFRERLEADREDCDATEFGGCACFFANEPDATDEPLV